MNNLGLLIKTNIINELNLNILKQSNKKEKNKFIGFIICMATVIGYLVYSIFQICFDVSDILILYNMMDLMLLIGFVGATLFCLFTTLYKASSYLFSAKDFDMLASLPIRESSILFSKIFMLLMSNYLFSAPIILIPSIVYGIKMQENIIYYISLILLFICIPLIPLVISSVISFLLGKISSKMRYKNIILIAGSIILIIGYFAIIMKMQDISASLIENSKSINDVINIIYFPSKYFVDGLIYGNFIDIIKFIFISLLIFAIFINLFSKQFKVINSQMNETYKVKSYKQGELKSTGILKTLIKKELQRYFSSYMYVLNSSIGMIILIILAVGIVVFGAEQISTLLELNLDLSYIKIQILGLISFCVVTSCTTYCSISLEGKNLWILKSSPINEIDIFKGKIGMNLLITIPISIISFLLISMKMQFEISFIAMGLLFVISVCLLISVLGLLLNLIYPNVNWKNEVTVIKRSISIMLVMLISVVYAFIWGFVYLKTELFTMNQFTIIITLSNFAITFIIYNIIRNKGVKLFRAI